MRNAMLGFTVALGIMAVSAIIQAQTSGFSIQKASMTLAHIFTYQAPPQARQNETAADKNISTATPDVPEQHFRKPQESFPKAVLRAAAVEIHDGAAALKFEAGRVTENTEEAITASRRKLEKLAQDVKKASATLTQALHRAFARAD